VSSNAGSNQHPFRVTLGEQRLADALAQELSADNVSVHAEDSSWIVSIDGARTDRRVVRVLDAIRDTLARQTNASALVQFDGQKYVMRGEDHVSTNSGQAATTDESAEPGSDGAQELSPRAAEGCR
jgi:hypothetical protein